MIVFCSHLPAGSTSLGVNIKTLQWPLRPHVISHYPSRRASCLLVHDPPCCPSCPGPCPLAALMLKCPPTIEVYTTPPLAVPPPCSSATSLIRHPHTWSRTLILEPCFVFHHTTYQPTCSFCTLKFIHPVSYMGILIHLQPLKYKVQEEGISVCLFTSILAPRTQFNDTVNTTGLQSF